ncbi:hypothetical protein SAMN04488115_11723 [Bosea lathyri]|uniref:Uncharacterized protein n=1 Tax=Bosea lathyri TaxID=1036778 RepID=A0A1H6D774_9HYPH|nr:hypothetical protein SAMN04488115_11723 [Bosea lathyri]
MICPYEEKLEQFHRREAERARNAGLSAYILSEDGSVVRIWPDGRRERIVTNPGIHKGTSAIVLAAATHRGGPWEPQPAL